MERFRRRKGNRVRQVTLVQEEPAPKPSSSPNNEEAHLTTQLAEHQRKKAKKKEAKKKEAKKKEAKRKRLAEEAATREAKLDSKLKTNKGGLVQGQGGSSRVQT